MNELEYLPIIDLHCDLLCYLLENNTTSCNDAKMGASLPFLKEGKVNLQVMAVYTDVTKGSTENAKKQVTHFLNLYNNNHFKKISTKNFLSQTPQVMLAIENAAGLCEEDMPLKHTFSNLDFIVEQTENIIYISLTHHTENRFGGGNFSENIGLKEDGEVLLDYLHNKNIAVDLAHTSDALAHGILNYTSKKSLNIPIIASHSNFRSITKHVRNLPNELVKEIIDRNGLIGINFLRAYIHNSDPSYLLDHIKYGLEIAPNQLCFGADFFYTGDHPDQSRIPFYFEEHQNATKYQSILSVLHQEGIPIADLKKLAYTNALRFIETQIMKQTI